MATTLTSKVEADAREAAANWFANIDEADLDYLLNTAFPILRDAVEDPARDPFDRLWVAYALELVAAAVTKRIKFEF